MIPVTIKGYKPVLVGDDLFVYTTSGKLELMSYKEREFITESVRRICQIIKPDVVIELGYGLGLTAQAFQDYGVIEHYIYEPIKELYENARAWAVDKKGVVVINACYQEAPISVVADLLYNDVYPFSKEGDGSYEEVSKYFSFKNYATFCLDYKKGMELSDMSFDFKVGDFHKFQILRGGNLCP